MGATAKGVRAGRAYVELGTDDSRLIAGLRGAQNRLKNWGSSLAMIGGAVSGVGAAITTPLMGAVWSASHAGDELAKMSDRTGVAVEDLSELRHAAEQSDATFEQLGNSLRGMQRNIAAGSDAFAELGLSLDDLRAMSPDRQFAAIAQAISEIDSPARRTAAAMGIFGRAGSELMPMLLEGASGIEALRKEARELGLQVSTSDARAATNFGDTWANVRDAFTSAYRVLGYSLLPMLTEMAKKIIPIIASAKAWLDGNRQLIVSIYQVASRVAKIGAGITALGGLLIGLSMAAGAAASALGTIGAVAAAITSPIGLMISGIIAGGAAMVYLSGSAESVAEWFATNFGSIVQSVSETVGGIYAAISNGRLDVAAKIAMTGVKLAVATVMESVLGLFGLSIDGMMKMLAGLLKQISVVTARLNVARVQATNWLSSAIQASLGIGKGEDDRAKALEAERQRIMREKGIETTDNTNSTAANLQDVQEQDLKAAIDGLAEAQAMDPEAMGKRWAEALDIESLKAELERLNVAAREPQPVSVTDVPAVVARQDDIEEGMALASQSTAAALGSFSRFAGFDFGGGVQQKQLSVLQKIAKNTDPANDPGGMTP